MSADSDLYGMGDMLEEWLKNHHEKTPPSERMFAAAGYIQGIGDAAKMLEQMSPDQQMDQLAQWLDDYDAWLDEQLARPDIGYAASQQDPQNQ